MQTWNSIICLTIEIYRNSVNLWIPDKMPEDKMPEDKMPEDKMPVDKMPEDKMPENE